MSLEWQRKWYVVSPTQKVRKKAVYVEGGAPSCVRSVKDGDAGLQSKNTQNIGWGSENQIERRQKGRVKKQEMGKASPWFWHRAQGSMEGLIICLLTSGASGQAMLLRQQPS